MRLITIIYLKLKTLIISIQKVYKSLVLTDPLNDED